MGASGQVKKRRWVVERAPAGNPVRAANLEISVSQDGCVVSRPGQDRVHFLNPAAVVILEFCTGDHTAEQIAGLVKQAYGLPEAPLHDVTETLDRLKAQDLLL